MRIIIQKQGSFNLQLMYIVYTTTHGIAIECRQNVTLGMHKTKKKKKDTELALLE